MASATLQHFHPLTKGFTLVELIVVIVILGILASGAAIFIANPTNSYLDTESRALLTDRAETTLRIMSRSVRNALPNSVRVSTNGSNSFIEFIPINAAGRYRDSKGKLVTDDPLDFSTANDSFDLIGPAMSVSATDQLVIYNLGTAEADAYAGNNRRTLTAGSNLTNLSFTGAAFPIASASSRFFIVSSPITYACDMATKQLIMYSNYTIQASQANTVAALNGLSNVKSSILAENITACAFNYTVGINTSRGLVNIMISMTEKGANVRLMHQVSVLNSS